MQILKDLGSYKYEKTDDYPDFGHLLAKAVSSREFDFGISICGTGNGITLLLTSIRVYEVPYAGMKS